MEGLARGLAARGFLSWGSSKRGIPASSFLSQLLLGSYPPAPPAPGQAGQPLPYANRGEIHLLFPSKGIFLHLLGRAQADLFTWVACLGPALYPRRASGVSSRSTRLPMSR